GLIGILKAGGAYLPLDPDYPAERLAYMVEDSGAGVLVTQQMLGDRLPVHRGLTVWLDGDWPAIAVRPATAPTIRLEPNNTAYVIYTSGSTGAPKGVSVSHCGLPNLAAIEIDRLAITPESRLLQFSSISFDAATWEIAAAIASGAALILPGAARSG